MDLFAILVLIICVIVIVFLIIAGIYFYDLMNLKSPSTGEATFLFWTSLALGIIFFGLSIYAMIRIFTYTSYPVKDAKSLPVIKPTPVINPAMNHTGIPVKLLPQQSYPPNMVTRQQMPQRQRILDVRTNEVIEPGRKVTNIQASEIIDPRQNISDIPITEKQKIDLNRQLISIGNAISDA